MLKRKRCVVSGKTNGLSQHHIVPSRYLKFFREEQKVQIREYNLIFLTIEIHREYERRQEEFDKRLCQNLKLIRPADLSRLQYASRTILTYLRGYVFSSSFEQIHPLEAEAKLKTYLSYWEELTNLPPTEQYLYRAACQKRYLITDVNTEKIKNLTDIKRFYLLWRGHFTQTMNPKYLEELPLEFYL